MPIAPKSGDLIQVGCKAYLFSGSAPPQYGCTRSLPIYFEEGYESGRGVIAKFSLVFQFFWERTFVLIIIFNVPLLRYIKILVNSITFIYQPFFKTDRQFNGSVFIFYLWLSAQLAYENKGISFFCIFPC